MTVPVRPKKHMTRPIALKRHFHGYVIWQTQLEIAPSKHLRIKQRRQSAAKLLS
jgi:hypothetical protein